MDGNRFDQLARTAAQTRSRRGLVRLMLGGALGVGLTTRVADVAARHHHHHHHGGGGGGCIPQCLGLECGPDGCGGSCGSCGNGQTCDGGTCGGGGGGDLPLETPCDPAADVCQAGLQCDAPTTRHTCSDTVDGIVAWCCLPPGADCSTECDCCGNNYCHFDDNNQGHCTCNPEGGHCSGGACNSDEDCNGNTPNCCNGTCVDLLGDANNCGDCGQVCDPGQVCGAGLCGDAFAAARQKRQGRRSHRAHR